MKTKRTSQPVRKIEILLLSIVCLKTLEMDACAYIDPGTGSMVLQLVAGILFAGLLTIKRWGRFVMALFRKNKPTENDDND